MGDHDCSLCPKSFHSREELDRHTRTRHRGQYHDPAGSGPLPVKKITLQQE